MCDDDRMTHTMAAFMSVLAMMGRACDDVARVGRTAVRAADDVVDVRHIPDMLDVGGHAIDLTTDSGEIVIDDEVLEALRARYPAE